MLGTFDACLAVDDKGYDFVWGFLQTNACHCVLLGSAPNFLC